MADWKAEQARVWGAAPWQNIAESVLSAVHDELLARLAPHPGDRWLDLATGTGAVALRAARAGAQVTALDLSPALVDTARRLAAKHGLAVRCDIGDAERLPYPDSSFDVISSVHGVVFATDHRAVARELARVCRFGGRLGLTYWRANPELQQLMDRLGNARPRDADNPRDWRQPEYVNGLLGADFELEFIDAACSWTTESGEAAWRLWVSSDGPAKTAIAALAPAKREALRRDWVDYFERHRQDGGVSVPRPYLLILGRRRAPTGPATVVRPSSTADCPPVATARPAFARQRASLGYRPRTPFARQAQLSRSVLLRRPAAAWRSRNPR